MHTFELIDGGLLVYDEDFLPDAMAHEYFDALRDECQWEPMAATFGFLQPRFTASYGDNGIVYGDSGRLNPVLPWTSTLLSLKEKIESVQGKFNYCHLCYYKSGPDNVSWHADSTDGTSDVIGSLSLGATRTFRVRHRVKKRPRSFIQRNGTLIIMAGAMQQHWEHNAQSSDESVGERMKLTFRFIEQ